MPTIYPRNVIVFGAPTVDRRFVLKLAGAQVKANHPSLTEVFESSEGYPVIIHKQDYMLYDTAGLADSGGNTQGPKLEARQALSNLYHLTQKLDGERVHLLIYVVSDQPSLKNLKLFYDYLCRQDVPMIVITTNHVPLSTKDLPPALTLNGALLENITTKRVRDAIIKQVKTNPKNVTPMKRFELTARESWKLLEREAGWSLTLCRTALMATFMEDAGLSPEKAKARCEEIAEYIKKHYFCNVILFGDTGVGKTSVIRMLTDECKIDTKKASSVGGSTCKSQAYDIDIKEYHYRFHDTVGLDDQTSDSMSPEEALRNLYQLIQKVDGGVSLLVYVHRGKIKPSQVFNYQLFSHAICEKKVPTVLVVTGLEQEDLDTDDWWNDNEHLFAEQNIATKYHACITSTVGKFNKKLQEFTYQTEYDKSKETLKELFLKAALVKPWKINDSAGFLKALAVQVYNIFATKFKWGPLVANPSLYKRLMGIVGMNEGTAIRLTNHLEGATLKSDSMSTLDTMNDIKVGVDEMARVDFSRTETLDTLAR